MDIGTVIAKDQKTMYWYLVHHIAELKGLLRQAADSISFDNLPTIVQSSEVEINKEGVAAIEHIAHQAADQCRLVMQNIGEYRSSIESGLAKIEAMQITAATISEPRLELLRVAAANAVVTTIALNRHREGITAVQSPWMADGDDLGCSVSFGGNAEVPFQVTFEPGSALVLEFGLGRHLKKVQP